MTHTEQNTKFSAQAEDSIKILSGIVQKIRASYDGHNPPKKDEEISLSADDVLAYKAALITLFAEMDLGHALLESGIPQGNSFGDETLRLIKSKILPYVHDERDLRTVARKIFHHKHDSDMLRSLTQRYGPDWLASEPTMLVPDITILQNQLESTSKVLSYRIAALGMEDEMAVRAGADGALITPFLEQNREINELLVSLEKNERDKATEDYAQAIVMLRQCQENIKRLDKAAAENGASLQQTFILNKVSLLIERLLTVLSLLHEMEEDVKVSGFFALISDIVVMEISPKKLRDFFARNTQLIAYRITENKRKTGEHYITAGWSEYRDMFVSASGGGMIVSFLVIFKLMIHHAHFAPLWEGLMYSLNYAIGFVMIHMLGFTLATKQPAMTAAYIAASLDKAESDEDGYKDFGAMIAAVSRSQLASFAGNLLVVFPVSLCFMIVLNHMTNNAFLDASTGRKMLHDIHPLFSLSALYAAFAGFYLFLSGLISGFGDNKVVVSRIGLRLLHHPWLSKHISAKRLPKIVSYTEKNLGPIIGNIAVGFMLGMTAFFGQIMGLPLDVRHVTFSTGNFALGLLGTHFDVSALEVLATFIGLFIIGLVNFLVSFFFALQVAIRSRGLKLGNYPDLARSVWRYFRHNPREFFWPDRAEKEKSVEEIEG